MKKQFIQFSLACGLATGIASSSQAQIVKMEMSYDKDINKGYFTGTIGDDAAALATYFYDDFDQEVVIFYLGEGQNIYAKGKLDSKGIQAKSAYYRNGRYLQAKYDLKFDTPTTISGTAVIDGKTYPVNLSVKERSIDQELDEHRAQVMKTNFGNYFDLYLIDKIKSMEFEEGETYEAGDFIITPVIETKTGVESFRVNHFLFDDELSKVNSALEANQYNVALAYWNNKTLIGENKAKGVIKPVVWNNNYIEEKITFAKDGKLNNASTGSNFYRIADGKKVEFLDIFKFAENGKENYDELVFPILNEILTRVHGKKYTDPKYGQVDKLRFENYSATVREDGVLIEFSFPEKGSSPLLIPKSELLKYQITLAEIY